MKFLLQYLKDYKKESILAPLFKMCEAVFELLVPLVMAAIIDQGIADGDTSYVIRMCIVLVVLAVVGLIFAVTAQYFAAKAAIFSAAKMRKDLFCHVMDMSAASHESMGTSALTTRITSDINQIQNGVNMFLRLFLRSPFIVLGAMVMALIVDVKATLIFVGVIAALAVVVYAVMKSTLPIFSGIQRKMEKIFLAVGENLEGARVIRAFGNQEEESAAFADSTQALYGDQMKAGRVSALLNPVTYVIVNLGIVVILWFGSTQVNQGMLAKGEVVALVNYMSQILVELIKLANLIVLLMRAVPSIGRVQQVMELQADERIYTDKEAEGTSTQGAPAVEYQDVSFCYPDGSEPALSHLSLTVPRHSTVGIIGGTGSGKSTLLQLLYHRYDVTEGQIRINGQDVRSYTREELSKLIGVVPQKAVWFPGTIRDNLKMGRDDVTQEMLEEAATAAQADNVIAAKEDGWDEEVLQDAMNFSGGQRQRLTIARALAGRPQILLLDDSASALDVATDAALRKAIRNLTWQPTVFIISQRASSVMDADWIVVLEDGVCVGSGTHETLLRDNTVYQEIYYSQFPKEGQQ